MKSVLGEASTVTKAIDKAWHAAGKPSEFTIKVFETERRNFFGFLQKAAVVSILFDPRKGEAGAKEAPRTSRKPRREQKMRPERRAEAPKRPQQAEQPRAAKVEEQKPPKPQRDGWTDELIAEMSGELKELCKRLDIAQPSNIAARGSTLRVDFSAPVIEDIEYERMLFSSFAHLLFQFIKREHRSKFRGLRIALSSHRD